MVRVRALIGAADERLALLDPAVRGAVERDVVVGGVGRAVRHGRGDQAEELVLDLVGRRIADQREIGLVGLDQVLQQRLVRLLPVQRLLDVGLLADDAGLEDGEVAGGGGRELLRDVLGEVAGDAGLARASPARSRWPGSPRCGTAAPGRRRR